jgi:hypothetical protein
MEGFCRFLVDRMQRLIFQRAFDLLAFFEQIGLELIEMLQLELPDEAFVSRPAQKRIQGESGDKLVELGA